jgi:hypothetical protein
MAIIAIVTPGGIAAFTPEPDVVDAFAAPDGAGAGAGDAAVAPPPDEQAAIAAAVRNNAAGRARDG